MQHQFADSDGLRVLHVLPHEAARGAQVYAHALRAALDGRCGEHRTITLFSSASAAPQADLRLNVPSGSYRRAGFDPRCLLRLRRVLKTMRPAITVAHGGEPLKYVASAGQPAGAVVYYSIGVPADAVHAGPRRGFYRRLVGRADMVAGVSQEVLDEIGALARVPRERLVLIPNGRDPASFLGSGGTATDLAGLPHPLLVWAGHLTPGKRPEWIIEIVRRLGLAGVDAGAALVGDGPLLRALAEPAARQGVTLTGRRGDMADILRAGDIFVFTSAGDSEGMPGVLIEAGMAGLPVVTTAVPGASTVVVDGKTGFVVPRDDLESFVDAVLRLALDENLRRSLGDAAKRRCLEQFSLEASVQRWEMLLTTLLPSRAHV